MSKNIAVLLAPGFEDIEAITVIDIMRRAGVNVSVLAVKGEANNLVNSSHGVKILADSKIGELPSNPDFDMVYLPGGLPGATNLAASEAVKALLNQVRARGGILAAICAAPVALDAAGVLENVDYTCYPGFQAHIKSGHFTGTRVQRSGAIITGCGPGATMEMAFEMLRMLGLTNAANQLLDGMQVRR